MQLFAFQVSRSSDSETDRSSHHDEGKVRLGREALRRRVQELGIASRGSVDLVEGLETNQKDGEEREYLHKTREARLTRQQNSAAVLMMFTCRRRNWWVNSRFRWSSHISIHIRRKSLLIEALHDEFPLTTA